MTNLENPTTDDLTAAAESLDAFRFVETNTPRCDDAAGRSAGEAPDESDNPHNAWVVRGSIRTSMSGPLAGRTVAVKNSVAVAGWPMANGTDALAGFVPSEDAVVVKRVLNAGAEIIGTSRCEFLCASGGSHTSAGGPVRNPHDPTRMAGGSSSGSAALVASGHVDLAIGGDQGGSIRMPSSYSGTVGMKPTHGLVPYTGGASIEATVDHLGPITATVADNARLLDVLAGHNSETDETSRSRVCSTRVPRA